MELNKTYPIILHPEDGQFWVSVPDVPSALTQGESVEQAIVMAREAIELALATTMHVPEPTPFSDVDPEDGFVQLVSVSLADYLKKTARNVRRNVSIPDYLDALAKEHGENVSKILRETLEERYELG